MARGKKRLSQAKRQQPAPMQRPEKPGGPQPTLIEYGLHLLIFIIFCLISAALVYIATGYAVGLTFFFGVLIFGFIVVCVFSFAHDRLYHDEDETEAESQP